MAQIGRYRIVRPLGEGGQAKVWLVQDPLDGEGRHLALKAVPLRDTSQWPSSLLKEFSTLAAIRLPGIPNVLDLGTASLDQIDDKIAFITRAYVAGESLDHFFEVHERGTRIAMVASVLAAVGPLHRRGVSHGDLKPSNILVNRQGEPSIIDFGLARIASDEGAKGGAGTPAYMAPEIRAGGLPNSRSDVYALAAILYEAVYGPRSFDHRRLHMDSWPDDGLHAVLRQGLEARSDARYPDAAEMGFGLQAALGRGDSQRDAGEFVQPRPVGFEALVQTLLNLTRGMTQDGPITLLWGGAGSGKTTILRDLKWGLQAEGISVIPLQGGMSTAEIWSRIFEHLGTGDGPDDLDATMEQRVFARMSGIGPENRFVVLVDDVNLASPDVVELLNRIPVLTAGMRVVGTALDLKGSTLDADRYIEIPGLKRTDLLGLIHECFGATDAAVVDAIHEVTRGRPAALIHVLRSLAPGQSPSARDIHDIALETSVEAEWASSCAAMTDPALDALRYLSCTEHPVPLRALRALVEGGDDAVERLVYEGFVREGTAGCRIEERTLRKYLRGLMSPEELAKRTRKLIRETEDASALLRADLALQGSAADVSSDVLLEAVDEAVKLGARRDAIRLLDSLGTAEAKQRQAELLFEVSDFDACLSLCEELFDDRERGGWARVHAARALAAAGRLDDVEPTLEPLDERETPKNKGLAARERARVAMRRGEYEEAIRQAEFALECLGDGSLLGVEALTTRGMSRAYLGEHEASWLDFRRASDIAEAAGDLRAGTNVVAYMGIARQREGELEAASELYRDCLERARRLGDAGSVATFSLNLGGVLMGQMDYTAAEHYMRVSVKVAARIGKWATQLLAQANLAFLCAYSGRYEEAARLATDAREKALEQRHPMTAAMAVSVLGDIAASRGEADLALASYGKARAEYESIGQVNEQRDAGLDMVGVALDAGEADSAMEVLEAIGAFDESDALYPRYRLTLARLRSVEGLHEESDQILRELLPKIQENRYADLRWRALAASALNQMALGEAGAGRLLALQAIEMLEAQAARMSPDIRGAFWQDGRRGRVRELLARRDSSQGATRELTSTPSVVTEPSVPTLGATAKALLDITKRLASEHDVERLLTLITDSAVDLSGAERGFVLTLNARGELEPFLVRHVGLAEDDPHVAFSRSIAESVLIDGAPLITVDASADHRLSEYVSVHQMMLKSVVALPIRGRSGILGVLYLEHRMRRGRFAEVELDVLVAFADQSAIALENAQLLREAESRHRELEEAHRALALAKDELERVLRARTEEIEGLREQISTIRPDAAAGRFGIVGQSQKILDVLERLMRVSQANVSVVIHGESGTGKELAARAVHYAGPRSRGPFITLNCGAIPEQLLESVLFGHVRGAFTGADRDRPGVLEQASGGTLFLDEVGDMPAKMQIDLLRVLQDGRVRRLGAEREVEVDVRMVSASHRSLEEMVEAGEFREDLFYRLHVVGVVLPPLRERREDIPLLVQHFLREIAKEQNSTPCTLNREAMAALVAHPLPGNVRQLRHILLNATILGAGPELTPDDLPFDVGDAFRDEAMPPAQETLDSRSPPIAAEETSPVSSLKEHKLRERQTIVEALEAHGWNRAKAARALGIPRRTFYRRLKEHDIL